MEFNLEKVPGHEIYHFRFRKCVWLAMAFIRIQEFYESPDATVRGGHNTLEDLIDRELQEKGEWTYLDNWGGFNVPGHVWNHFFSRYPDVRPKEDAMRRELGRAAPADLFYVVGSPADEPVSTMEHEFRHGLWYLYDGYRRPMIELMRRYPTAGLRKQILKLGYHPSVIDDEVQAYVLTGLEETMRETKEIKELRRELRKIEKKFWPQVQ